MTEYATEVEISIRHLDLDTVKHVNNAVYVTYLEEARLEYIEQVVGISALEVGTVLATVSVEYERPILLDQQVVVGVSVTDIGRSSLTMAYEIRADGMVAATAETVIVKIDPDGGGTQAVPTEWRERIAEHEGRSF